MVLPDVNLLIYAYRDDNIYHEQARGWLQPLLNGAESFALSDLVCSGFLRVVTNQKLYKTPSPPESAFDFIERIRNHPNCVVVAPSTGHWSIFFGLCRTLNAEGGFVADVYLAALAIDANCEWCSIDRDFLRIPGLKLVRPF